MAKMPPRPTSYLSYKLTGQPVADRGGRGVFARKPVRAGEVLAAWGGEVVHRERLRHLPSALTRISVQIEEELFLVPSAEGPADWINHSCEPNAGLRGQVTLVALRDIVPGEEICYDYAMSDGSDYDALDCCCGTANCRGRVTGQDWRLSALMAAYAGFFSPYLERRIEREQMRAARRRLRRA